MQWNDVLAIRVQVLVWLLWVGVLVEGFKWRCRKLMAQRGSTRRSTNIEGRLRILMMRSPCFIIQERNGCLEGRNRYMPYLVEENVCSVWNLWSISISIIVSILYEIIVFGKCFEYFTCKFWLFWIENMKWVCYEVIVIVFTLTSEICWAWYFLVYHEQTMDLMSWCRKKREKNDEDQISFGQFSHDMIGSFPPSFC